MVRLCPGLVYVFVCLGLDSVCPGLVCMMPRSGPFLCVGVFVILCMFRNSETSVFLFNHLYFLICVCNGVFFLSLCLHFGIVCRALFFMSLFAGQAYFAFVLPKLVSQ